MKRIFLITLLFSLAATPAFAIGWMGPPRDGSLEKPESEKNEPNTRKEPYNGTQNKGRNQNDADNGGRTNERSRDA